MRDVGGEACVKVSGADAEVLALGLEETADDMALLRVEGLNGIAPLPLRDCGSEGCGFLTAGYSCLNEIEKINEDKFSPKSKSQPESEKRASGA
ncbi:MAG: hypothetical protein GY801_16730 [bacterium]|nr:hypothetical protein [bacterium]